MRTLKYLFTVPKDETVTEKHFRRVLIASVCSILMCMSCLAGTTWALFVSTMTFDSTIQMGRPEIHFAVSAHEDMEPEKDPETMSKGTYAVKLTNDGNVPGYGELLFTMWGAEKQILRTATLEPGEEHTFTLVLGSRRNITTESYWGTPEKNPQKDPANQEDSTAQEEEIPVTVVNNGDTIALGADFYTVIYNASLDDVEDVERVIGTNEALKLPEFEEVFGEVSTDEPFRGWKIGEKEFKAADTYRPQDDVTIEAVWGDAQPVTYTITFAANGGTGEMAQVTVDSEEYILPTCGFAAPQGAEFKAWQIGQTEYAAGDKIELTADTTVTALWQEVTEEEDTGEDDTEEEGAGEGTSSGYTVSFDANGGTGEMTQIVVDSAEYTLPECGFTAPDGKEFKAWTVDGAEYQPGSSCSVTADTVVTAVWDDVPPAQQQGEGDSSDDKTENNDVEAQTEEENEEDTGEDTE